MDQINLLIIEDEETQIKVYNDVLENFNKKNANVNFKPKVCQTFEEGRTALQSPNYDAAIIDLKLSKNDELEGRTLIEEVYKKIRVPIFVYSGSIAQIDDIPENALLRKKLRTEKLNNILEEIVQIFNTGITTFLKPNGIIDTKLSEIFWNNLSKDINLWISHNNRNTLLRYIFSYFQEYLDINADGDFDEYHPAEVYLAPPIKTNLHTGDILKIREDFFLVLTPACDIVFNYKPDGKGGKTQFRKAEKMMLSKLESFDVKKHCLDRNGKVSKGKIHEYITNNFYRYHYLPPFNGNSGFLVDFQELISEKFEIEYSRVATIAAPFIKDIISRFANYYSRQGQPTFSQQALVEKFYEEAITPKAEEKNDAKSK